MVAIIEFGFTMKIKIGIFIFVFSVFPFSKIRESIFPYLSGDGFRSIASYVLDDSSDFDPSEIVESCPLIFVCTNYLDNFFLNYHPYIASKYILITHNSDYSSPGIFYNYLEDKKMVHWFGANPSVIHSKFTPIPTGVHNRYFDIGRREYYIDLEKRSQSAIRNNLVYSNGKI